MTAIIGFRPEPISSTIAVTSSSQRVVLSIASNNVYLSNVGTKECFVAIGDVAVVAVAGGAATAASDGSMAIPPGFYGVISRGHQSNLAAICGGSDTTTLRLTPGEGR